MEIYRSAEDPEFFPSTSELDDSFVEDYFSLCGEKKYPSDEKVFLIYESKLLELLEFCNQCGQRLIQRKEIRNTGSQLTLQVVCEKGMYPSNYMACVCRRVLRIIKRFDVVLFQRYKNCRKAKGTWERVFGK